MARREPPVKLEAFIRAHSSGNPETVNLYLRECRRFTGWLGPRALTLEAVQEYQGWLQGKYRANSLQNKAAAVNLYLKWKGTDYRIKRPRPEVLANPKLITDAEYEALIGAVTDPAERLVVRILHDSFLRPSDVVNVRLSDIDRSEGVTCIRKETRKTGAISESFLTKETAAELEAYIKSARIADYLFPGENGRAF